MQTNSFSRIKGKVPYNFFWSFVYFLELRVIFSFSSWKVQQNNRFRSNRHSRVEMCPMAPCAICGYPQDRGTARGIFFLFFFSHENFVYLPLSCCDLSLTKPRNVSVPLQTKLTISLPSHTLQLVKSQQFHIHQAVKRVTLFWAEPPVWGIIGSTPPPNTHPLPTSRYHCLCYSLLYKGCKGNWVKLDPHNMPLVKFWHKTDPVSRGRKGRGVGRNPI